MAANLLVFSFADSTSADGNRYAGSLADTLHDLDPEIQVERLRERAETQDFGATPAVILGTAPSLNSPRGSPHGSRATTVQR
jgi:hypothetical protein